MKNWYTRTADKCKLPGLIPDICENCCCKRYCKRGGVQLSIWDLEELEEADYRTFILTCCKDWSGYKRHQIRVVFDRNHLMDELGRWRDEHPDEAFMFLEMEEENDEKRM